MTHESRSERDERRVDVDPSRCSQRETSESMEPSDRSLDDPAVATEALFGFDSAASDSLCDAALSKCGSTTVVVVALVGVNLRGSASKMTSRSCDRGDRVDHRLEHPRVVHVGRGHADRERDAFRVDDDVVFGAEFASIRGVRARLLAPPFARTDALSTLTRSQSIAPLRPSSSRSTSCSAVHTPSACQSRRRRQHVMPDPHPISFGSSSHWMPVFSTNRMPVSAARSSTRGRPPRGYSLAGGIKTSMRAHSSSGRSGFAMGSLHYPLRFHLVKFC